MIPLRWRELLRHAVSWPAQALDDLADAADEAWAPFLDDDLVAPAPAG